MRGAGAPEPGPLDPEAAGGAVPAGFGPADEGAGSEDGEADHGYTGTASNDDLALRVSEAADGAEVVGQTLAFASALSEATAHRSR